MRKVIFVLLILIMVSFGAIQFSCATESSTQQIEAFWCEGKNIEFIVGRTPGGGHDTYTRLLAPTFQKYLSKVSSVVVINKPGAGGIVALNELYNNVKPDGLTIGLEAAGNMLLAQISENEAVGYDSAEFRIIGRISSETHVLAMSAKSPYDSLDKLKKADEAVTLSFSGAGSDDYIASFVVFDSLGIPYSPIAGYGGQAEATLAAIVGEVDGILGSYSSMKANIDSGKLIPVLTLTRERSEVLPSIPGIAETINNPDKALLPLAFSNIFELDRIVYAPPGLPSNMLEDWREVFDMAVRDPELLEKAEKAQRPISYLSGEEVEKKIKEVLEGSSELRKILEKY